MAVGRGQVHRLVSCLLARRHGPAALAETAGRPGCALAVVRDCAVGGDAVIVDPRYVYAEFMMSSLLRPQQVGPCSTPSLTRRQFFPPHPLAPSVRPPARVLSIGGPAGHF